MRVRSVGCSPWPRKMSLPKVNARALSDWALRWAAVLAWRRTELRSTRRLVCSASWTCAGKGWPPPAPGVFGGPRGESFGAGFGDGASRDAGAGGATDGVRGGDDGMGWARALAVGGSTFAATAWRAGEAG